MSRSIPVIPVSFGMPVEEANAMEAAAKAAGLSRAAWCKAALRAAIVLGAKAEPTPVAQRPASKRNEPCDRSTAPKKGELQLPSAICHMEDDIRSLINELAEGSID